MTITFGSLFAGIGGFDLGFERVGMVCRWQVEIDPFCQKVLAKHWPDVARYSDVRDCGEHNLEPVDLICGGFPCQPHSVAGKRRGAEDDRDLWPEYRRIVAELRPRWVVGENVPGIRSTILDAVLSDLEHLDYTTRTFVIPACALDALHKRERVWIIAYGNGGGFGQLLQSFGQSGRSDSPDTWGDGEIQSMVYAAALGCDGGMDYKGKAQTGRNGLEVTGGWTPEPNVGRVANGVPSRVDRLRALGNAVVPQVAEWLGRQIVKVDE